MELRSPAVGKVLRVNFEAGAEIEAGAEVMVIESMKMEIPIKAPSKGRLVEIRVRAGDHVQRNRTVAVVQ